jgi:AcrR family transcriptional regulator
MTTAKRKRMRPAGPPLTRDDWLAAAYDAVVAGGFDQLLVLQIAKALRVSRGSFYWHFTGQAELQGALLERWRSQQFAVDATLQAQATADPRADLEQILATALAQIGAKQEHVRFELALRGLARRDETVARMLAEVDALRMSLFERKFLQLTGDAHTAAELAALFYLAVVGCYQALSRPGNPPQLKDYLQRLLCTYLIQPPVQPPVPPKAGRGNNKAIRA